MGKDMPFLKVRGTEIVDEAGQRIMQRGVALGGWLNMEGYMMCGRNIAEKTFKAGLARSLGKRTCDEFTEAFRSTFIREDDIALIARLGANCIRVPFNYRVLGRQGIRFLDRIVEWCRKHSLRCILDMHAAPGSQNPDWHSDCDGRPTFFRVRSNQKRYLGLWRFLADRYKSSSAVAGYDVLNEPVVVRGEERLVKRLYEEVTAAIRSVDKRHIIFLEALDWGRDVSFLGRPADRNTAYSIHLYDPIDFTFNWVPGLRYPGARWNRNALEHMVKKYRLLMDRCGVPCYVGEFGVNFRDGHYGELGWVDDMARFFNKHRFHWTYWTYKTVANSVFPDGIYRYAENPAWVNRKGPVTGWENFYSLWKDEKKAIIDSWKTANFLRNGKLCAILKGRFRGR